MLKLAAAAAVAAVTLAGSAFAQTWTMDAEGSQIAFGSVKKDKIGEVHTFSGLSGTVGADGAVRVEIDLTSLETNIDIRNERMAEHVFGGIATASLSATLDMEEVSTLAIGGTTIIDFEGVLSFLGQDIDLETEMFVARLAEDKVLASTNGMVFVGTEDLGISAGIDKLMELAKLPGITRTVPVTVRFLFTADDTKVEAAPAAPATSEMAMLEGDVKQGKKVFKKCKACHSVKAGKNSTGPSLHGLFGATAGHGEGFKYSDAMGSSGVIWNTETLTAFLADPKGYMPGNTMAFKGLKKDKDILNVLTYLQENTK